MKGSDSIPRFSLIVPAYNEEAYLPALLKSVHKARTSYVGGADAIEVLVVDNASTDATADLARRQGCRVVREEKRVIAAVRNAGAREAWGQIFVFVDADSVIHPDTFNAIDKSLSTGKVIAGTSGVKMQRMSLGIAVTYLLMVPLVWLTGMDTGVVFCRREDFRIIGGYNEGRLYAEDVQLLWDLMLLGRKRQQKLARTTSVKAIFSTRKFDDHGDWHYWWLMARFLWGLVFSPRSMGDFALTYWYSDERTKPKEENKTRALYTPDTEDWQGRRQNAGSIPSERNGRRSPFKDKCFWQ
ncbi:MAG: glycosyltransferase [Thermodesulfobacteriota bacterium]|nr:glycosyltransferase [Thermodesulfobacteriota bacterium]